jgi:hypothetical protein
VIFPTDRFRHLQRTIFYFFTNVKSYP